MGQHVIQRGRKTPFYPRNCKYGKVSRHFRRIAVAGHAEKCLTSGKDFVFQQDGAACHTSKKALKWMEDYNVPLLEWVSSSPDLSPIETLWHAMKKVLRTHPSRTIPELKERLQEIWNSFTPQFCEDLVNTMPQRISAVIKNKGDVTQW